MLIMCARNQKNIIMHLKERIKMQQFNRKYCKILKGNTFNIDILVMYIVKQCEEKSEQVSFIL